MLNLTNEVNPIRKIVICFLSSMLLAGCLILQANAANLDSKAGVISVSSGRLNVRAEASSGSGVVTSLNKGSYVTLISLSGSWWKVEYAAGKYGYCHADYITAVSGNPVTVNTSSGNLNVRNGAGTSYAKTGTVNRGEVVIVLSSTQGWSKVLYGGTKTGYVSSQYLSTYYSPVSLWVYNMKQMDSRWANKPVATSGKTFAQIGCATTAIAMLESHRTGIVNFPDVMSTMLTYTPSGNVYWPSHYTTVTNGNDLLSGIYKRLQQGKPILFGATNQYGSQHWVVITGFTGGSSITADKFTINDPGSYTRTNLQQFLSTYPNFYKYFYY